MVMNNVFRTDLDLHRKYDLKGSTYGRTAGPRPGATGEWLAGCWVDGWGWWVGDETAVSFVGRLPCLGCLGGSRRPGTLLRPVTARYLCPPHLTTTSPPAHLQPSTRTWTWTSASAPTPRHVQGGWQWWGLGSVGARGQQGGQRGGRSPIHSHLNLAPSALPCCRLAGQLAADALFLEDIHVMDYSLLMGVHVKSFGETSASPLNTDKVSGWVGEWVGWGGGGRAAAGAAARFGAV